MLKSQFRLKCAVILTIFIFSLTNQGISFEKYTFPSLKDLTSPDVTYWAYQLQNVDIQALKNSNFDLFVIDYSQDGSNATAWTKNDLNILKNEGKFVISYLSIGEAEDYRYYWHDNWSTTNKPSWLGPENPDWQGNYKVKFWEKGWQDIIYKYLDIIIAQGFNGVYLDIIDAYLYFEDQGVSNAKDLMINFVQNISNYAKTKSGNDFLIIPQNGEELLDNSSYRSVISGIGIEDLYYHNDGSKNSQSDINSRESLLSLLTNENKLVLTVDYVKDRSKQQDVYTTARSKGFIPYTTDVALDTLTPPLVLSENSTNSQKVATGYDAMLVLPSLIGIAVIINLIKKKRDS